MTHNLWSSELDELVARVRLGDCQALEEVNWQLEKPDQNAKTRAVLRSLRAYCLMHAGEYEEAAKEAAALLPFAERHDQHYIVAQCYRVLANRGDLVGDQKQRCRFSRLALEAARRTNDPNLVARIEQEIASIIGMAGRYDEAAEILLRQFRSLNWSDPEQVVAMSSVPANLGWLLNLSGRPEQALAVTGAPEVVAMSGYFAAAARVEHFRAKYLLGEALNLDEVEALLAVGLENGWFTVTASLHVLSSQQFPASSSAAKTHVDLALNIKGMLRSSWREHIVLRGAECARAHGEHARADALEAEAMAVREAARQALDEGPGV